MQLGLNFQLNLGPLCFGTMELSLCHDTTSWLFVLDRNPTVDCLASWGLDVDTACLLCGIANESRNHLFLCQYSNEVWFWLCAKLNHRSPSSSWNDVLCWLASVCSPDRVRRIALLQAWQAAIYVIWQERNTRFYSGLTVPASVLGFKILRTVTNKCTAMFSLGQNLGLLFCAFRNRLNVSSSFSALCNIFKL